MKTNKTLSYFFKNCSNPELFKKVWKQGNVSFEQVKQHPVNSSDIDHPISIQSDQVISV